MGGVISRSNTYPWVLSAAQLSAATPALSSGRPLTWVDGWGGLPFRARSLFCVCRKQSIAGLLGGPIFADTAGDVVAEVEGISDRGTLYLRRFTLSPYQTAWIPTDGLLDIRVRVLRCGTTDYELAAIATDGDSPPRPAPLILAQRQIQPGTWYAPPGAYEMIPAVADAGFSWSTTADTGGATTIGSPAVIGAKQDVLGGRFTVTVANWACLWRIAQ